MAHNLVDKPYGVVQSKLDRPPAEARRYHPGTFPALGESGTATSCGYSTPKRLDMYCLLHNPGTWLFDCEVQVERRREVPLGKDILSSFAAVPHSYGSVCFERGGAR
jgi:hypothetical protein